MRADAGGTTNFGNAIPAEGRVVRPPGVRLDSGGLGKGLAADGAAITGPSGRWRWC